MEQPGSRRCNRSFCPGTDAPSGASSGQVVDFRGFPSDSTGTVTLTLRFSEDPPVSGGKPPDLAWTRRLRRTSRQTNCGSVGSGYSVFRRNRQDTAEAWETGETDSLPMQEREHKPVSTAEEHLRLLETSRRLPYFGVDSELGLHGGRRRSRSCHCCVCSSPAGARDPSGRRFHGGDHAHHRCMGARGLAGPGGESEHTRQWEISTCRSSMARRVSEGVRFPLPAHPTSAILIADP